MVLHEKSYSWHQLPGELLTSLPLVWLPPGDSSATRTWGQAVHLGGDLRNHWCRQVAKWHREGRNYEGLLSRLSPWKMSGKRPLELSHPYSEGAWALIHQLSLVISWEILKNMSSSCKFWPAMQAAMWILAAKEVSHQGNAGSASWSRVSE